MLGSFALLCFGVAVAIQSFQIRDLVKEIERMKNGKS